MRDRELEIQADARDKQREMEEIEEVLRKKLNGEIIEPVPTTATKIHDNKENEAPSPEKEQATNPNLRPAFSSVQVKYISPETSFSR